LISSFVQCDQVSLARQVNYERSSCQIVESESISLTFNQQVSGNVSSSCQVYYFTLSENIENYLIQVNGSYPLYVGFGSETFEIPVKYLTNSCELEGTSTWYLIVFPNSNQTEVNFVISVDTVTLSVPLKTSNTEEVSLLLEGPSFITMPLENETFAQWIEVNDIVSNSSLKAYGNGEGVCPEDSLPGRFRTHYPNISPVVEFNSSPGQINFSVSTYPVTCQKALSRELLVFCPSVTYSIANWENATDQLGLIALFEVFFPSNASESCKSTFFDYICSSTFPMCDTNGFDMIPCVSDCEKVNNACAGLEGFTASNCTSVNIPGVQTHCYIQATTTTTTSSAICLSFPLTLLFLFVTVISNVFSFL